MTARAKTIAACDASVKAHPTFKRSDWRPYDPSAGTEQHNYTLDAQIAEFRREVSAERRAELNREWNAK